ncbi:S9 family peptidase [Sediminibacter sp. Hel_I_10]|uniref:alpha/beta hydrolase family protein n=1 Tax=Sediminibacter sp. Hel_I_10 TaxID=1392490 RepID=UPI0005659EA9|nr:alpha/beta hydrolase [Sediminibacter sp. Hel_I_10]
MKYIFQFISISFFSLISLSLYSQDSTLVSEDIAINKMIDGTLLQPKETKKRPLAIIIAGSGPTDRNGNQNLLQNNSLKKLATGLAKNDIATFRYDKRVVKQIKMKKIDPNTTFDDFVIDAKAVLDYFIAEGTYSKIYVVGHSQGSLVGMLAAKDKADGFISLAGAGRTIDEIVVNQIGAMDPSLIEGTKKAFESLKAGKTTSDYPVALGSIFRADVQPFMINWMKYNPAEILPTLEMPQLIVNGTKDLQVSQAEAQLLKDASETAELEIIKDMNHVLFTIEGDTLENSKSYNESSRPVSEELIMIVSNFILKH